jgi:hypothetical protein
VWHGVQGLVYVAERNSAPGLAQLVLEANVGIHLLIDRAADFHGDQEAREFRRELLSISDIESSVASTLHVLAILEPTVPISSGFSTAETAHSQSARHYSLEPRGLKVSSEGGGVRMPLRVCEV